MAVATKTAAKAPAKSSKAAPAKTAAKPTKASNIVKSAAIKIKKGIQVCWTQRTRTGEKTYRGTVMSAGTNGKRIVRLTDSTQEMKPREEWLSLA